VLWKSSGRGLGQTSRNGWVDHLGHSGGRLPGGLNRLRRSVLPRFNRLGEPYRTGRECSSKWTRMP
jgi:hypothetical protein